MSVLELKGGILELVSRLNDEASLTSIYETALHHSNLEKDWFAELPVEAQDELKESIQQSDQATSLYTAEQVRTHLAKWRK